MSKENDVTSAPVEPIVSLPFPETVPSKPIAELLVTWMASSDRYKREIKRIGPEDDPAYIGGSAELEKKGMWSRVYALDSYIADLITAAGFPISTVKSGPFFRPTPHSSCESGSSVELPS